MLLAYERFENLLSVVVCCRVVLSVATAFVSGQWHCSVLKQGLLVLQLADLQALKLGKLGLVLIDVTLDAKQQCVPTSLQPRIVKLLNCLV